MHVTGDVDDVPPTIGAAVYRIAQESVTNARRHARGATRIEVLVQVDDAGIRLDVHDDGDRRDIRLRPASASRHGRARDAARRHLLGRALRPSGGWTVSAVLPRSGWST